MGVSVCVYFALQGNCGRGMRTNVVNKSNRILNISNSTVFADATAGVVEDRKVVVTKETLHTVGSLRSAEGIMRHFITR